MKYTLFKFPHNDRKILALGAELKSTFCAVLGETAYLSETFNDLKQYENFEAYRRAISEFMRDENFQPEVIVADLHPDYVSTRYGRDIAGDALVQAPHHFAHAAACMADNEIDEPVLGVSFDGSGYGIDGDFWGGEFVVGGPAEFHRAAHLRYVPLPGADKAALEPWRMAVAYLYETYGKEMLALDSPVVRELGKEKILPLLEMMEKRLNCPLSSSIGRLFDAVASILRLTDFNRTEAEAAIALQNIADANAAEAYDFEIAAEAGARVVDPRPMIRAIVADMRAGRDKRIIAGKFHATVAAMIERTLGILRDERGLKKVVLAGGVFLNSLLKSRVDAALRAKGFEVYFHKNAPTGDASISLGQAYMLADHKTAAKGV
jgi:hydrogenase maturation protein HypF